VLFAPGDGETMGDVIDVVAEDCIVRSQGFGGDACMVMTGKENEGNGRALAAIAVRDRLYVNRSAR
jgi:hypothetical protein